MITTQREAKQLSWSNITCTPANKDAPHQ